MLLFWKKVGKKLLGGVSKAGLAGGCVSKLKRRSALATPLASCRKPRELAVQAGLALSRQHQREQGRRGQGRPVRMASDALSA